MVAIGEVKRAEQPRKARPIQPAKQLASIPGWIDPAAGSEIRRVGSAMNADETLSRRNEPRDSSLNLVGELPRAHGGKDENVELSGVQGSQSIRIARYGDREVRKGLNHCHRGGDGVGVVRGAVR